MIQGWLGSPAPLQVFRQLVVRLTHIPMICTGSRGWRGFGVFASCTRDTNRNPSFEQLSVLGLAVGAYSHGGTSPHFKEKSLLMRCGDSLEIGGQRHVLDGIQDTPLDGRMPYPVAGIFWEFKAIFAHPARVLTDTLQPDECLPWLREGYGTVLPGRSNVPPLLRSQRARVQGKGTLPRDQAAPEATQ